MAVVKLLSDPTRLAAAQPTNEIDAPTPMLDVFWRRRYTLLACVGACTFLALFYLLCATRVYRATARVRVDEAPPKILDDRPQVVVHSETFGQTQVAAMESAPVLNKALEKIEYRSLHTFDGVDGDAVQWLRRSGSLNVDMIRKSDVIEVTMESPYKEEAIAITDAVVTAFMEQQTNYSQSVGGQLTQALRDQQQRLVKEQREKTAQMLQMQREQHAISFAETSKGNTVLDRAASLSASLTAAEVSRVNLKAEQQAAERALSNPDMLSAFVSSLRTRGREWDDREYDDLQAQMTQLTLMLSTGNFVNGANNPRVQQIENTIATLKMRIEDKEKRVAAGYLMSINEQLVAAEEKERSLREVMESQREQALAQNSVVLSYDELASQVDRIKKQLDQIENRISQVSLESSDVGPLAVQVLEPARIDEKPVRPRKTLTVLAAMIFGGVLGMGLSLLREWQDSSFTSAEEIGPLLGTPVLAMVPPINNRLPATTRGQLVRLDPRSPAAEAFRDIRTSLQLGSAATARTILLASPMSGDGKSTTASNLAIAFAQSGERTILIDCDLRRPVQHHVFQVPQNGGVSTVLSGKCELADALRLTSVQNLCILPAGPMPVNPSELIGSRAFGRMLDELAVHFDRIIIDSPAMLNITDARIIAARVDATMLVLRIHRSMRRLGQIALDGLSEVGAKVIGAVANDATPRGIYRAYDLSWQYTRRVRQITSVAAMAAAEATDPSQLGMAGVGGAEDQMPADPAPAVRA